MIQLSARMEGDLGRSPALVICPARLQLGRAECLEMPRLLDGDIVKRMGRARKVAKRPDLQSDD